MARFLHSVGQAIVRFPENTFDGLSRSVVEFFLLLAGSLS